MAQNDFKPFAIGSGANVTSQADWEALSALVTGFQSGKASSAQVNKAIRQASFISAALAQFVSDKNGADVLDDGDLPGFVTDFISAVAVQSLTRANPFADIKADGTVNTALSNLGLGGMGQTYSAFQDNSSTTTLTASFTMTPPSDGVLFVNSQFLINNYTTAALWTPSATGGTVKNVTGQYNSMGSGAFAVSVTKGTSVTVSSRINQATAGAMKSSMTAIFVPTVG